MQGLKIPFRLSESAPMPLSLKEIGSLLAQTFSAWMADKAPQLGAALAFYTALSMAPLLVLSLRIAAIFFGAEAARGEIQQQMHSLMGEQAAEVVQAMLQNANQPKAGAIATTLGLITLLVGASGVFFELQDSLNTIWDVQPAKNRSWWDFLRDRFLSMAMVMVMAFLLMVSLIISAVLAFVGAYAANLLNGYQVTTEVIHFFVSLGISTGLFALMFKYLPDVTISWRDVWLGAAITALLFSFGKLGIGLYLGRSTLASSYGVAGSLIVLLVWVYYSAQIFFFGAEFTQVYANRYGSRIVPTSEAPPATPAD